MARKKHRRPSPTPGLKAQIISEYKRASYGYKQQVAETYGYKTDTIRRWIIANRSDTDTTYLQIGDLVLLPGSTRRVVVRGFEKNNCILTWLDDSGTVQEILYPIEMVQRLKTED